MNHNVFTIRDIEDLVGFYARREADESLWHEIRNSIHNLEKV